MQASSIEKQPLLGCFSYIILEELGLSLSL